MIGQSLAGKRIFLTGGTGFVGTAFAERVLHNLPDTELVILIRPGRRATADDRMRREILNNNCFDSLKEELGKEGFQKHIASRISAVAGDVSKDGLGLDEDGLLILGSCDVAVHSAATVSFDAPLDSAIEVNLLGPSRVAETYRKALETAGRKGKMVSVSTAYVAGSRKGKAFEVSLKDSPLYPDLPWRQEVDAARRLKLEIDSQSRSPEKLKQFRDEAQAAYGAAGVALLAQETEKKRVDWVRKQMVKLGQARAQSLGWADAYAYSKALGEIALEENKGSLAVSVVRPSIIESALKLPYPGWIRGFRMAEPIIVSFARGLLGEFPGVPEGTVDVVPVDLVVSAILAACAIDPSNTMKFYHVASGSVNPLKYGQLVDLVTSFFGEHPVLDSKGQPIALPSWKFPGRGRVQGQLKRATRILSIAESVSAKLPIRSKQLEAAGDLTEKREIAERALGYVELYGAYVETEAIYQIDNLIQLRDLLDENDLAHFDFDPKQIEWETFVYDVHLPSVVEHSRIKTTYTKKTGPTKRERTLASLLAPSPSLVAFDLENTLLAANVVDSFSYLATSHLDRGDSTTLALGLLAEAPKLLALDRRDRTDFLRYFYRRYKGADRAQLEQYSWDLFDEYLLKKAFPKGIQRVREHRRVGHKTVLITGALDFIVAPFAPLFDKIIACEMVVDEGGRLTGEVLKAPPIGENRAAILLECAEEFGIEPANTIAYADSTSDLPMLEAAGQAVCVNGEARLLQIAKRRGWHTENWEKAKGGYPLHLPIGVKR